MPIIESVMGIQVIGNNGENIIKSPIVEAYIGSSLLDSTKVASDAPTDISTKVEQLMAVKHSHSNKAVLDKFAETDGKPTYNGEALGGGASDFIIRMTVETEDGEIYTVTSCDATFEQIDAAVAAEKKVVVIATDNNNVIYELPMISGVPNVSYMFSLFLSGLSIVSTIRKNDEGGSYWVFVAEGISAYNVNYRTPALPNISTVEGALDTLVPKSHTHANKDTLDKLSDSNGKLQYNGSDVGLKGDKGDTPVKGTDYWTAVDKAEIVADTLAALPTWTGGNY